MKSKKVLFELLEKEFGEVGVDIAKFGIDDETYGKRSFIYFFNIMTNWSVNRERFEDLLRKWGFKPNRNYCRGNDHTEVQVSYFKGWHWDE
jgi:hypothetical protein